MFQSGIITILVYYKRTANKLQDTYTRLKALAQKGQLGGFISLKLTKIIMKDFMIMMN